MEENKEIVDNNPKYLIINQECDEMEDMTEGQLAEYLAENFNDYGLDDEMY